MLKLIFIAIIISGCFAYEYREDTIGDLNNTQMTNKRGCYPYTCCFTDKVTFSVNYDEKQNVNSFTFTGKQTGGENCPDSITILTCGELTAKTPIYGSEIKIQQDGECKKFLSNIAGSVILQNKKCQNLSGKICYFYEFSVNDQFLNSLVPNDVCEAQEMLDHTDQIPSICKQDTSQDTPEQNKQNDAETLRENKSNGNIIFFTTLYFILFFIL